MDDLKQFRQLGSKTSGHPEHQVLPEVEVTTGPLGQGISNAIGLAIAQAHLGARFNKPGHDIINHKVWCVASDGDMMEGVQFEAVALAGHHKLGNLICFWDDNKITICGKTDIAFTEDVCMRFRSSGWHTIDVPNADTDLDGIARAIDEALAINDKPVLIDLHTTIGFGSVIQDTAAVHGAPLNAEQMRKLKEHFGFNPDESFVVPKEVYDFYEKAAANSHKEVEAWNAKYAEYKAKYPAEYAELQSLIEGKFDLETIRPLLPMDNSKTVATRVCSGLTLNALAAKYRGFFGGSADLTPSCNTGLKGETLFAPGNYQGRYFEYGIREHGMQAIANGISYYGFKGVIPFTASFFVFIQYLIPALRCAALESLRVLIIMTHDSIGVGEDGSTHQPVENLALIRVIPNCNMMRPADQIETSACYAAALTGKSRPTVFAFSRQTTPPVEGTSFEGALKGGYVIKKVENPKIIFVGTGTELDLCIKAAEKLNVPAQIVSLPCMELFEEQTEEYRVSVLPPGIPVLSVEAGVKFGWDRYSHLHCGVDEYGVSAPGPQVYEYFGLTPDGIAAKAQKLLDFYANRPVPELISRP